MNDYVQVLETRDLGPGQSRDVEVRGARVLLTNIGRTSGERLDGAGRPLRRYAVRVEGNAIKVGPPLEDG